MATKTIKVTICDRCGEIIDGTPLKLRLTDPLTVKQHGHENLDMCGQCLQGLRGYLAELNNG